MAESTPSSGVSGTESALIYDAGEHRTHAEHATEAHGYGSSVGERWQHERENRTR